MRNPIILMIMVLSLITGCKELINLQTAQDQPDDIQLLLAHNEFARVRQLTEKYPAIATPELQTRISMTEAAYAKVIYSDANNLESENELFDAVQLLSTAIRKVPNSNMLIEYRNRLDNKRHDRIRVNERQQMVSRAEFILNQRRYHQQQHSLQAPGLLQRWEKARMTNESKDLSTQLREHGEYAFKHDDPAVAQECLQLSVQLDDSPETRELLDLIKTTSDSQHEVAQQQASLNKKINQRRNKKSQSDKTGKLLEETRQALLENDLLAARDSFMKIPSSATRANEVRMLHEELKLAVNKRVNQLTTRGDREYRADDVIRAISTWSEALKIDPENQYLKERLERAGRVLAKLEHLKQLQGK